VPGGCSSTQRMRKGEVKKGKGRGTSLLKSDMSKFKLPQAGDRRRSQRTDGSKLLEVATSHQQKVKKTSPGQKGHWLHRPIQRNIGLSSFE